MHRTPIRTSIFLALVLSAGGSAAHARHACDTAVGHADRRACLARDAAASWAALTKERAALVERIDAWDEEPAFRQRALTQLQQSFDRFNAFRDAHCEYRAALAAGGNGASDLRLLCQADLNRQYTASLRRHPQRYPAPD